MTPWDFDRTGVDDGYYMVVALDTPLSHIYRSGHDRCASFKVIDGMLSVVSAEGIERVLYAAGTWKSVTIVKDKT